MKTRLSVLTLLVLNSLFPAVLQADTLPKEPGANISKARDPYHASAGSFQSPNTAQPVAGGQTEPENLFRPRFNLRLGAVFAPQVHFAGGLDIPLDGLRLSPEFSGRLDIEFLLENYRDKPVNFFGSFNASGTNVYVPVTLNQVYVGELRRGGRIYGGFGAGGVNNFDFFNNQAPSFVGKLFVGAQFTPRSSAELGVYFIEDRTFATLQLRLGL